MWFPFRKNDPPELVEPPCNEDQLVFRCMELLQSHSPEHWKALQFHTNPVWVFCLPSSLSSQEKQHPSLDFVLLHTLVPLPDTSKSYKSLNGSATFTIKSHSVVGVVDGNPLEVSVQKKETLYTPWCREVYVVFIETCFSGQFDGEVVDEVGWELPKKKGKKHGGCSVSGARSFIEKEIKRNSTTPEEALEIVEDFFWQIEELTSKFTKDLARVYELEANRFQKNNLVDASFHCQEWAMDQLSQLQHHILLSLMALCNRGGDKISSFSHLLQPIEEYVHVTLV